MEYSKFLYEFNNHIGLAYFIAVLVVYGIKLGTRSYYIAAVVTIIVNLVMMVIEPKLVALVENHPLLVKHAWYPTWAICNILSAITIYKIHSHERIKIDFVAMSCLLSMVAMCIVQSLRYMDMVVFEFNLMGSAFRVIVNTVNVGYLAFLMTPLFSAVKEKIRKAIV
ncbi:hypothetical protein [Rheinheimera maricola]|uniref:Uncharacterized protein n=1 Tax=Rheinheimera maricola TaxID=2793282 RepID=A0ABS7XBR3_9GAMM|nr:hypothetical protein [Rheinheimera maricola]MBZ9612163.1 hypothetical protein [Rheinheimera maricola]